MTTKQKSPARSGLGAALAASITSEMQSIDDRFARADSLFEQKEEGKEEKQERPKLRKNEPRKQDPTLPEAPPKAKAEKPTPAPVQEKVIRDTFSFPPSDYQRIAEIKTDALHAAIQTNKSEVVRAGLIALQELPADKRYELLQSVEKMKPGRPG